MKKKSKGLPEPAARRLAASIGERSGTKGFLRHQWVETFNLVAQKLVNDPKAEWPWSVVFWIRLNGVLDDLDRFFRWHHDACQDAGHVPPKGTLGWHVEHVFEAIQHVRGALTEDEAIFAQHCRHLSAHVFQDAYYIQGKMDQPALQETLTILGKQFSREDLMKRIHKVGDRYGADLNAAAADFARKVAGPALELYEAHVALRKVDHETSVGRGLYIDAMVESNFAEWFKPDKSGGIP